MLTCTTHCPMQDSPVARLSGEAHCSFCGSPVEGTGTCMRQLTWTPMGLASWMRALQTQGTDGRICKKGSRQLRMRRAPPGGGFAGMLRAPAALASCARGVRRAVGCGGSCSRARAPRSPLVQAQVIELPLSVVYQHLRGKGRCCLAKRVAGRTGHGKRIINTAGRPDW